jgi:hypothetical protein
MLVFHWLLQILLRLIVLILSLCVGLLKTDFLLLFTSSLNVQFKTVVFRCKYKVYIVMHYHQIDYMLDDLGF